VSDPTENLETLINAIPSGGEWWKRSTGYTYQQAGKKLVELGMQPAEAANFLSDLFNATSEEFGA